MKRGFLILGYGIPPRMSADLNYQIYLRSIFNSIYQQVIEGQVQPVIVCAGGPTDMIRPYRRTEAGEMVKELQRMWRGLPGRARANWVIQAEPRSFSLLENIQFGAKRLSGIRQVTVFCETTRVTRARAVAKRVFRRGTQVTVRGIDFDASKFRYLDPALIREKERVGLRFDLWALKSARNMRRHHFVHQDKIRRLRDVRSPDHIRSVRQWFEETIREFPKEQRRRASRA